MAGTPWYYHYDEYRKAVQERKDLYDQRCKELGVPWGKAQDELWREIVARIVHESNWQENLYLDMPRTKELVDAVLDDPITIQGPHLDLNGVGNYHRKRVIGLKRRGATIEEIAAFNLSQALVAIRWIGMDLAVRQAASMGKVLAAWVEATSRESINPEVDRADFQRLKDLAEGAAAALSDFTGIVATLEYPLNTDLASQGEWATRLIQDVDFDQLLKPMKEDYIHFLHRLTVMGLTATRKCGVFRKVSVHMEGNWDLHFPPPSLVPGLMREFCEGFPTILPTTVKYDPVIKSAMASHAFVKIHPYCDGNGRVSRLLMNLVLWGHFPPVALKADKKGRHRYIQALRRADRGNIEPLACLIAMALIETYDKLIKAVSV